jgi:hypothetical protein
MFQFWHLDLCTLCVSMHILSAALPISVDGNISSLTSSLHFIMLTTMGWQL